jgi:hypothetical protein
MTNLIVNRLRHWTEGTDDYRIVIDGDQVASIGAGESARIELGPGHYDVAATGGWVASKSIGIDGEPAATHHLIVAHNPKFYPTLITATLIVGLPLLVFAVSVPRLPSGRLDITLMRGRHDAISVFMLPLLVLVSLALCAPFLLLRESALALVQAPGPDLTDREIADFLRAQPLRPRFTLGGMMILLAILATNLAVGVQLSRNRRQSNIRELANMHAKLELPARAMQRQLDDDAADLQKRGINAIRLRQAEARSAARADYHAVMRRKYEQALSQGWFKVENDPPPPAWP